MLTSADFSANPFTRRLRVDLVLQSLLILSPHLGGLIPHEASPLMHIYC